MPRSTLLLGPIALTLLFPAGCGLDTVAPNIERPFVPDRGVGPWRLADLEVCGPTDCGEDAAGAISGLDVCFDPSDGRFLVAAALEDGTIHLGKLREDPEGWLLTLEAEPILTPDLPWQQSGLRDPDLLLDPPSGEALALVFATADGLALGYASGNREELVAAADPIVTIDDGTIHGPSAVIFGNEVVLAYAGQNGEPEIYLASGPDLRSLGEPLVGLGVSDITNDAGGYAWGPLSSLDDPDLGVTNDGLLRAFFSARGTSSFASDDADAESSPINTSIGYAAADQIGTLEPYADNPVHDRTYGYLFRADERSPSVANDGVTAVMLYSETLRSGAHPALAVHRLGR